MENNDKIYKTLPKQERFKKEPRKSYLRLKKEDFDTINESVPKKPSQDSAGISLIKQLFSKESGQKTPGKEIVDPPSTDFNDLDEGVSPSLSYSKYSNLGGEKIKKININEFLEEENDTDEHIFSKIQKVKNFFLIF